MKQKQKNRAAVLSLVLIALVNFTACAPGKDGNNPNEIPNNTGNHQAIVERDDSRAIFARGESDYKIVLPDAPTAKETTAATELEYFFRLATSYGLETVNESDFTGKKFISIGQTTLLSESKIEYKNEVLGDSGFKVITKDDGIYLFGSAGGDGSIYAAYEFLRYAVGYEYYAADEYTVAKTDKVAFYRFDITEIPTIQMRQSNDYLTNNDSDLSRRLRFNGIGEDLYIGVHTELQIMPYNTYKVNHPEWYANGGLHLCYSAGDELKAEFIKNVERDLAKNEQANRVTLGLSDNNSFCGCEKCSAAIQKYGTESSVMILFLNDVIPKIEQWLKTNYPARQVRFQVMAYQKTVSAPATKQADGTFKANAEEVKCIKNLGVIIYDSGVSYAKRLDSERNQPRLEIVQRWAALSDEIVIGTYATNFSYFFCNYPNYLAIEDNYTIWANNNVVAITEMGNHVTKSATFEAMRNYLISRFMWNSKLDYQTTVKEFMNAYYKEASNAIYEYFTKLTTWQKYCEDEMNVDHGYLYFQYKAEHWPKNIVDSFQSSINDAYAAIEPLKTSDSAKYEKLYERIKTEELSLTYIYLNWHQGYFTRDEKTAMLNDLEYYCTKLGITNDTDSSNSSIFNAIAAWRSGI